MKKLLLLLLIIFASLFLSQGVLAQVDVGLNYGESVGLGNKDPRDMAVSIIQVALGFLGLIAVVVVLYAGYLWMTSNGEPAKVDKAKKVLVSAFIGLIIVLMAFGITQFVISRFLAATGTSCNPGVDTRACGCGGSGTQVCNVSGTGWDPCPPVCTGATSCCCQGGTVCDVCPCPVISSAFTINVFSPPDLDTNVIRNKIVRTTFSHNIDGGTVQGNYRLRKTSGTDTRPDGANCAGDPFNCASDRCDTSGTGNCIGNDVASSTLSVSGNRITFTPFNDCPVPYAAWKCFDANATYIIEGNFASPIQRAGDGANLTCGPPPCQATFDTGIVIDTQNPTNLNIGMTGNYCIDTVNNVTVSANDDTGIDYFDFYDTVFGNFDTDNAPVCSGSSPNISCSGVGIWNPTTGPYTEGDTYSMTLEAMDSDSNLASINRDIILRPAHCCNAVQDGDEEGVNCGGSCAACQGSACGSSMLDDCGTSGTNCSANNNLCASGYCDCIDPVAMGLPYDCQSRGYNTGISDCCLCQDAPIIDWVTPWGGFCRDATNNPTNVNCLDNSDCASVPGTCDFSTANGAGGNLITIGGRYFGDATGTVWFDDGSGGWEQADFAYDVNNLCHESWTDTQIIVEVPTSGIPAAIDTTTIRIREATTGNLYEDTTGPDGRGPQIEFIINTIGRPGLCRLNPNNGRNGDAIDYYGINMAGSNAFYGNLRNRLPALSSNFLALTGVAQVPSLLTGPNTTFAISPSNVGSNYLNFFKNEEPSVGPYISSFDPLDGAEGQYVSIYGEGFGWARSNQLGVTHHVYFDTDVSDAITGTPGDFNFPEICAEDLWKDNQVIVKVPAGLTNLSNYFIVIDTPALSSPIDSSNLIPTAQVSPTFQFIQTAALKPSVCHVSPLVGPANSSVRLYGEYFDAHNPVTSIVRFNYLEDQSGALSILGPLISWDGASFPNRIESIVPTNAATGPLRVVKGPTALEGNGIIFRVGTCEADADCGGGNVCCPYGSSEQGRCVAEFAGDTYANCYIDIDTSVYEWDFSTGVGPQIGDPCYDVATAPLCNPIGAIDCSLSALVCDPGSCSCQPPTVLTCQGFGSGQCDSNFCPNSPGDCSFYPGGNPLVVGSCADSVCDGLGGVCTVPPCTYNANIDKCDNGAACDLPVTVLDALNNPTEATCEYYAPTANGRWFITTSASCPVGWTSVGGGRCMEDLPNTCIACASGFNCFNDTGSGVCAVNDDICPGGSNCNTGTNNCERDDNSNCECCCRIGQAALDCCAPLDCTGDCGRDASSTLDTDVYGYCTGCADAGTTQADHDLACNCTGTSGKYCDTSDPRYPTGVCRDCVQLSTSTECNLHQTTCCVDAMDTDACRGGDGSAFGGNCEYYICNTATPYDCLGPSLTGIYSTSNCDNSCAAPDPAGGRSCYTPATDLCDIGCGTGHLCLGDNGCIDDIAAPPTGCGATGNANDCRCCCSPTSDQCGLINTELICTPDKSPCDTQFRGLCCGCTEDNDCVASPLVPTLDGCGVDSCCHQRPSIASPPIPSGTGICRNPLIKVIFDELMDPSSFSGNVYMVGDYGTSVCPEGTTFLVKEEINNRHGFARLFSELALSIKRLLQPITRIATAQTVNCAIPGSVRGYNSGTQGVLTFSPSIILDSTMTYNVIIRGDSDPSDSVNNGVKNAYGVSYLNYGVNPTFNSIVYNNSYTWSFDTGTEICTLDYILQDPNSWLFNTSVNDAADDPVASPLYDTIYDSDKVFYAYPKTSSGQDVVGVPGVYDWDWSWSSDNTDVAQVTNTNDPIQLVTAQHRQDAKTFIRSRATIVDDLLFDPPTIGSYQAGRSQVYVFMCDNPWPPRDPVSGSWAPWLDNTFNCTHPVDGCSIDNHFELYYCRDTGGIGPADDLPAIASSSTIIRGMSATSSILKEFYFFREATPLATDTLMIVDTTLGGRVQAAWPPVAGVDGYRLYYGVSPGDYSDYIDLDPASTSPIITGLSNNINYYFAFTSYYLTGGESGYSTEVTVMPTDQTPPPTPTNLVGTAGNGQAGLTWDANTDTDTDRYKVYIGTASTIYGSSQEVGDQNTVVVGGLTNGVRYYFVVTALDRYDNESGESNEVFADIDALAALPSSGSTAVLTWSASGPVGEYFLYYEVIP